MGLDGELKLENKKFGSSFSLIETIGSILFFLNIDIKSLFIISRLFKVFFKASESFKVSSFFKDSFDLSRLSIKFNDSRAKTNPP